MTLAAGREVTIAEKSKILLVDDQPENLFSEAAVLERLGQEVVQAQSGREALRYLLDDDFAVILLDVMMPEMDGFETAALIRSRERSRYTPIIFITALGRNDEHLFRGYEVGAVDYLTKPLIPEVLRSKVSVFIELSRNRRLMERQTDLLWQKNQALEQNLLQLRKAEAEIKRLNGHLERRVAELSAANQELDSFCYTVSHDLRAPLIRIEGFSRALLESHSGRLDEQGCLYLRRVQASSQRMCQLVEDLLSFSRVSRAEVHPDIVSLSEVVQGIAAELKNREPQRPAEFVIAGGLQTIGDSALLRIALANLLENAWKFTRNRSGARIEFGALDQVRGRVYFVSDNGAGFDPSLKCKLFNAFQRLHANSEFEGTGIGLATVDRIVTRHGGRIWAEGQPGHGATFYFTLEGDPK